MSKCLGRDISVRQHSKSEHGAPATSRHHHNMTERLLKAMLSPNQTNKHTKFGENPLMFTKLSSRNEILMDGHMNGRLSYERYIMRLFL